MPFEIVDYLLPSAWFDVRCFLKNNRVPKMSIFVHFYLKLHFEGYMLHELDDQTYCDHFIESLMKIGWLMSYSSFFFSFSRWQISTCTIETKFCGNLHLCETLFVKLDYLDHNSQTIVKLVEQISRKLTICVFNSTCKKWKREKIFWKER